MKKKVFVAGLALAAGALLFRQWKKGRQERPEEDLDGAADLPEALDVQAAVIGRLKRELEGRLG